MITGPPPKFHELRDILHTIAGVAVRVYQRILALTVAIWHNDHTRQPVKRSLIAYDH